MAEFHKRLEYCRPAGLFARPARLRRASAAPATHAVAAMGVVTAAAALAVVSVAVADANPRQPPPQFPNIDAYPAVNLSAYEHRGTHPGNSGWFFKAPNGITCAVSMLDDIGATCWGAAVGPPPQSEVNASSLQPGKYSASDPDWNPDATLLSVGTRLDNTNGVACAVISDDSIACRVAPNKGIDLSRPENSRYGVHGFVIQPAGNWTF